MEHFVHDLGLYLMKPVVSFAQRFTTLLHDSGTQRANN